MLEGLVAWVLNNYLGKYVENLNTDQLSVALLSGKVELENLPLKKDALRHLGLPVEVRAGFIGKVQLQVPVRQIRSAPWVIAIEKLYLVAAPVNLDEWDPDVEALIAHERKVALLDALEAGWRARTEAADASYYATSYSSWLSYGTGLLANIVENLQLKLNDVHIRFEDGITCAPSVFACGLTVEALAAESCDAEWRRGVALLPPADPDGCSFKILELQKLAVYWDPVTSPNDLLANCSISELTERMTQTWLASHRYMLEPASATARVRRERTAQPLRSRTRPRLTAHLTLNTVALNLNSRQYSEIVGCALGLEQIAKLREFRELRPSVPVKGHARDWWIYALKCHTPNTQFTEPKPTWETCLLAAKQAREYVEICLFTLSNPTATLPAATKQTKDEYEWKTPLHTLKALREVAMRKVPKATPVATPDNPASSGRSMLVHWFPQWWGWYGQPPADQSEAAPPPAPPPAAPPDLEEEILDVLADSLENNTLLKRDTVFGKFEFVLSKGCLNLSTEENESETLNESTDSTASSGVGSVGVELQFSAVCVKVESRPRASSLLVSVSLGSVALRERVTPATLFPVLVAPMGMIRENLSAMNPSAATMSWCRAQTASPAPNTAAEPLFQLTYEKKPFGLNCDYKLWVKSQSLEVVWCAAAARWALGFARGAWGAAWARPRLAYATVRDSTKQRLITHIEHMMHPHPYGARWALGFARGAWGAAWARPRLAYATVRDSTKQRLITHIEHMMHPHPVKQEQVVWCAVGAGLRSRRVGRRLGSAEACLCHRAGLHQATVDHTHRAHDASSPGESTEQVQVVWWALGFARGAWGAAWARPRLAYATVRDSTKQRLITHIEHMMHPHPVSVDHTYRAHDASSPGESTEQVQVVWWALGFARGAWGAAWAQPRLAYGTVRDSTKQRLITHIEHMMHPHPVCKQNKYK
ncbi:vacuolar protein sorting-associated protein 13D [Phthorimaea operculella]|nr:vacuolar protein sorting-associated protein 13D [Phthorimaea operculella]